MGGDELIGSIHQHAAKLDRRRRQAQEAVPVRVLAPPHVVEQIGKKRQGARVLGGFLRRVARDIVSQMIGFEAGAKQRRRFAHHLAQLRLTQRRHIDFSMRVEERLIVLQVTEKIGAHAHQHAQTRISKGAHRISEKRWRSRSSART